MDVANLARLRRSKVVPENLAHARTEQELHKRNTIGAHTPHHKNRTTLNPNVNPSKREPRSQLPPNNRKAYPRMRRKPYKPAAARAAAPPGTNPPPPPTRPIRGSEWRGPHNIDIQIPPPILVKEDQVWPTRLKTHNPNRGWRFPGDDSLHLLSYPKQQIPYRIMAKGNIGIKQLISKPTPKLDVRHDFLAHALDRERLKPPRGMRVGRRVQHLNETFPSGQRKKSSPTIGRKKLTQLALDIRIKKRLIEKTVAPPNPPRPPPGRAGSATTEAKKATGKMSSALTIPKPPSDRGSAAISACKEQKPGPPPPKIREERRASSKTATPSATARGAEQRNTCTILHRPIQARRNKSSTCGSSNTASLAIVLPSSIALAPTKAETNTLDADRGPPNGRTPNSRF
eukprot:jgi/Botrbrau1/145/Bobra.0022s0130.1